MRLCWRLLGGLCGRIQSSRDLVVCPSSGSVGEGSSYNGAITSRLKGRVGVLGHAVWHTSRTAANPELWDVCGAGYLGWKQPAAVTFALLTSTTKLGPPAFQSAGWRDWSKEPCPTHSMVSQVNVCHAKLFAFVKVTYWRELAVGLKEVRNRDGEKLDSPHVCEQRSFRFPMFVSMQDFFSMKNWDPGLINLITMTHLRNSWASVPPGELYQHLLAVDNTMEDASDLQPSEVSLIHVRMAVCRGWACW